ncbi:MAG: indole-3-glycerol phosphate synthase TrpC [Cyclobacteriaceae bacterium]
MNILDQIVADKLKEVEERKSLVPTKLLEQSVHFSGKPLSMSHYIRREDKTGIIAEIKRKSPSKGTINKSVDVEKISIGYMQAGSSGLSILTDKKYFGGTNEDLTKARNFNYCPILRKDFIVDEYQIVEAKSIGADTILLIAAALTPQQIKAFAGEARSLGMEVLLEVHNREELESSLCEEIDLLGVNNRDLKTFNTDIKVSKELASHIPDDFVKISESGISSPETIAELMDYGFEGFLIGENFMKTGNPGRSAGKFIDQLRTILREKATV